MKVDKRNNNNSIIKTLGTFIADETNIISIQIKRIDLEINIKTNQNNKRHKARRIQYKSLALMFRQFSPQELG